MEKELNGTYTRFLFSVVNHLTLKIASAKIESIKVKEVFEEYLNFNTTLLPILIEEK